MTEPIINKILDTIRQLSDRELRVGQIVTSRVDLKSELYYMDDERLLERLEKELNNETDC